MSDDDRALSEDDGADLFESEPEDHGSEVGHSLDLPSLSIDSLYDIRSPQQPAEETRREGVEFENTGCETDHSDIGGLDVHDIVSSPVTQPIHIDDEAEHQKIYRHEDNTAIGDDPGEDEQNLNQARSDGEIQREYGASSEDVAMNQSSPAIPQSESPKLPDTYDQQRLHEDEKQADHEKHDEPKILQEAILNDDCTLQRIELTRTSTSSMDNTRESEEPNSMTTSKRADETLSDAESDELEPLSIEPEAHTAEPNTNDANFKMENSFVKLSPHTEVVKSSSPQNAAQAPVYTIESLFPVVYEKGIPSSVPPSENAKVVPRSNASTSAQKPHKQSRRRRTEIHGNNLASRLAALQAQLDAARNDLANLTRTHKLQLSMVETDNKMLSQRNARLKNQLSVVTADLQRSNAEMAKLKTENELYAAKLPRLQAELLEETSQVDETQAKSVQTQLVLTQLKARSHVLQSRNLSLESQNNKLTQQLRKCQQQLKRKVAALQQQTEKANKVEAEMSELKTTTAQEKLDWKNRLATALQRFEHVKNKLETQFKTSERKELREAKDRAEKAVKKRRTAETTAAKLEEQLMHCKQELSSANDAIQRHVTELRTLESLLRKAHRIEATLRNDMAACKTRLRTLQEEKKRRMKRPAIVQTRRLEQQIPIELLLPLTDSSDEDNQDECNHCITSSKSNKPQSPQVCNECPQLQDQLRLLQQELRRVRSLHNIELRAQASVLDALLKGNVTPM